MTDYTEAPRIIFDRFVANNPDVKLEDLIYNIRTGVSPEGVIQINFETRDKYVDIDTSMSCFDGNYIIVQPHIYDKERLMYLEDDLDTYDEYLEHPDYYCIRFIIEGGHDNIKVLPLKHEYHLALLPDNIAYNTECLKPAEIVNEMEANGFRSFHYDRVKEAKIINWHIGEENC